MVETASAKKAEVNAFLKRSAFGALHCGLYVLWLKIGNVMQASEMKENKHGLRERWNCWKAKKLFSLRHLLCDGWALFYMVTSPASILLEVHRAVDDNEEEHPTLAVV